MASTQDIHAEDKTAAVTHADPSDKPSDGSFLAEKSDGAAQESTGADDEKTRVHDTRADADDQATQQLKIEGNTEDGNTEKDAEATRTMPGQVDPDAERRRETERRRAERDAALGTKKRRGAKPVEEPVAEPVTPPRTTDKFLGSTGLFILRIVTAGIMALHGLAKVLDIDSTIQMVQGTLLGQVTGQSTLLAYGLGVGELLIALALLLGFGVRIASVGLIAITVMALVFVHWVANPFDGYVLEGELPLLLAAVGVLLFATGGGRLTVDYGIRRSRRDRRTAKAATID